ncbi:MAG: polyprenyl synthetase family protein [Holosporales bacterium]|jgi:geranylgeranyl pyrophosphate synthase|nr:polyprenyl synthetase family protein [Holosporales bacterium]
MIIQEILSKKEKYKEQLAESAEFLRGGSGKRVRSILFYMFSDLQKLTKKHHETVGLIETIHNASIMHDDVIDMNTTRRGKDSLYGSNGAKIGILTGDFLVIKAMKRFLELHRNDAFAQKYLMRECHATAYGALSEQNLNQYTELPCVEKYLRMCSIKTSPLFKLSCLLGAHMSGKSFEECKKAAMFGVRFGVLYQIQNDLDSYSVSNYRASEDYMQKNITLPIIILCQEFRFSLMEFKTSFNQEYFEKIKKAINSEDFQERLRKYTTKYERH